MNVVIVLEWNFSPRDYFEEVIEISNQGYTMTIGDGQVHAKIDSAIYEANPDLRQRLHEELNGRFLGVQLVTHRAYKLSRATMMRVHPDGHRDIFWEAEPGGIVVGGSSDYSFTTTDKDGNVITFDSKRDRIEKKRKFAELVSSHGATDALLATLLRSYDAAVNDPNNELVHLYEIPDALFTKFTNKYAAQKVLSISDTQWGRLTGLCNDMSLRQGRHRGQKIDANLRDATQAELTEARSIARAMIEAYLQHLVG